MIEVIQTHGIESPDRHVTESRLKTELEDQSFLRCELLQDQHETAGLPSRTGLLRTPNQGRRDVAALFYRRVTLPLSCIHAELAVVSSDSIPSQPVSLR